MAKPDPFISNTKQTIGWELITAGMLSLSLVTLLALLLLIGSQGLSYFWPAFVYQFDVETKNTKEVFYGEIYAKNTIPTELLKEAGMDIDHETKTQKTLLIKIGNRESEQSDFITLLERNILEIKQPKNLLVAKRVNNGYFYGFPIGYTSKGETFFSTLNDAKLSQLIDEKNALLDRIDKIKISIEDLNARRVEIAKNLEVIDANTAFYDVMLMQYNKLEQDRELIESSLASVTKELADQKLIFLNRQGKQVVIPFSNIVNLWFPNQMNALEKTQHWLVNIIDFVSNNAKKSSEEKGIFPAIFGTILMVLIMSIVVMPLGVLAAVYLHEYAKKNTTTRLIRIAVANLAGVPSIVYGVFGLGFFVYFLGGSIDKMFYEEALPNPTFGTPGLLWSSLTLGLLTLPVVIVSTEEGLKRIPSSIRYASLALGATKFEVLRTIVLPMASPAMMTGLILAIARAAGEVAPLMLVGVVKLAQSLPFDGEFPFLHLDRKFMHLGYHIYDLSMSDANVEAVKPLVYATSLLLVLVVIGLNLTAVMIRNHLREKYRMLDDPI